VSLPVDTHETVLGFRPVEGRPQRHLALILARELASQLATATFIADASGSLVFYNERAEEILGRTFAEAGTMPAEGWGSQFLLEDLDGSPLPLDRMPAGIALMERRPAHGKLWMTGLDGERRLLSVTAVPLFSSPTEFVGMVAVFWQEPTADDD
jgi:PAS domain-containing protein